MLYHLWVVGTLCCPFLDFVEFFVDLFIWRAKCCTVWTSGPLQQSCANFSRIGLHILFRIVIAILFPLLILARRQLCSAFLHCLALLSRFYVSLLVALFTSSVLSFINNTWVQFPTGLGPTTPPSNTSSWHRSTSHAPSPHLPHQLQKSTILSL